MEENRKPKTNWFLRILGLFVMCVVVFVVILLVAGLVGNYATSHYGDTESTPQTTEYNVHITIE